MVEIAILFPVIIIFIGFFMGIIIGFVNGLIEITCRIRDRIKPDPPPIIVNIGGKQYKPISIDIPEYIFEQLNSLEFSADTTRQEINQLTIQSNCCISEIEKTKMDKKLAAAYKRLYADYKKIDKIKTEYGIL